MTLSGVFGVAFLVTVVTAGRFSTGQLGRLKCGINETPTPCTQLCPPTCEDPNPNCRVDCERPSCNCIPGFVYSDGRCIPANSCHHPVHCRTSLDCRNGLSCYNGVCGASSGVYTRTILTSTSHHLHHSVGRGCSRDLHCDPTQICIDGRCVLASDPTSPAHLRSCSTHHDCALGRRCIDRICR